MKKCFYILAISSISLNAFTQEVIWKLTYDVSIPFSDTREFTDQVSWRGASMEFDRFLTDNLAAGLGVSWSVFLEKEPDSYYQRDRMLIHGTQVRYINTVPLLARISWYQAPSSGLFSFYVTAGVGAAWQELRRDVGLWTFGDDAWQFALSPEVGVIFPVWQSSVTAKFKYVQGFETSAVPSLSYLSAGVGIAW